MHARACVHVCACAWHELVLTARMHRNCAELHKRRNGMRARPGVGGFFFNAFLCACVPELLLVCACVYICVGVYLRECGCIQTCPAAFLCSVCAEHAWTVSVLHIWAQV